MTELDILVATNIEKEQYWDPDPQHAVRDKMYASQIGFGDFADYPNPDTSTMSMGHRFSSSNPRFVQGNYRSGATQASQSGFSPLKSSRLLTQGGPRRAGHSTTKVGANSTFLAS